MLMAEAGDCRAAGCVEDAVPILGNQPDAFAANRPGWRLAEASMQDAALAVAHVSTFPATGCDNACKPASVRCRDRSATQFPQLSSRRRRSHETFAAYFAD
jgi:hypothetical protein